MLSTIQKGSLAEKIVEASLIYYGACPYIPSIASSETDLIAEYEGRVYKLQVKSSFSKAGRLRVDTRRPSAKGRTYSAEAFDILAVVDLATKKVAYISRCDIPTERFRFFTTTEYKLQGKHANYTPMMLEDYLDLHSALRRCVKENAS